MKEHFGNLLAFFAGLPSSTNDTKILPSCDWLKPSPKKQFFNIYFPRCLPFLFFSCPGVVIFNNKR